MTANIPGAGVSSVDASRTCGPTNAAPVSGLSVGIYRITNGVTTIQWLCAQHLAKQLAEQLAEGWTCEKIGDTNFTCDRCDIERQGGAA